VEIVEAEKNKENLNIRKPISLSGVGLPMN
jgi:hypothetical protein